MQYEAFFQVTPVPGTGVNSSLIFTEALKTLRDSRIGSYAISFPHAVAGQSSRTSAARSDLGEKLQLFASKPTLEAAGQLLEEKFGGYLDIGRVRPVQDAARYISFRRIRSKDRTTATINREVRRTQKRAESGKRPPVTDEEMRLRLDSAADSHLPYLRVHSHSTGKDFSLFFEPCFSDTPVLGDFDSFGFSRSGATVPYLP